MTTLIPSIVCLGVIGRNNNPLHMSTFASHNPATNSLSPVRNQLQFSLLLSSTIDIFELRSKQNTVSGDFGLLHAIDDRLAAYGHETNTGVRMVAIVDMRGRVPDARIPLTSASVSAGGGGGGGGGMSGANSSGGGNGIAGAGAGNINTATVTATAAAAAAAAGLRDAEMKPVFRAMQGAYVRLLQNPFYDPDEHAPLGGKGGKKISNRRFVEEMRRIGDGWAPGVVSF